MVRNGLRGLVAASLVVCAFGAPALDVPDDVSVLCVEADSGRVVYEFNADAKRPPASMVKMMLMLLVSEGLDSGTWTLDTTIAASAYAQSIGGSQVYLKAGEAHTLSNLMLAIAVKSANDAATCVAEGLWGSVDDYLDRMNERAQELGMADSMFHSVHGLPPSPGDSFDQSTANDMAILARECLKHPIIRNWTTIKEFNFRANEATLYNTNKLLWRMENCDGLKTGYIRAAGFCLTATAHRENVRLVTVVMGHPNANARFRLAEDTFNYGFDRVRHTRIASRGDVVGEPIAVRNSARQSMKLAVSSDLWVTALTDDFDRIELQADLPSVLVAPVSAGSPMGELHAVLDGHVLSSAPLVAPEDIEEGGWELQIQTRIQSFAGLN
jgi:D-alanyl-D-alanine carboxypeptidase (penicillin-binding protein 5/6)